MIDFGSWVARAEAWTSGLLRLPGEINVEASVDPPLNGARLERLQDDLPYQLPPPLRAFLEQGSAKCSCRYVWTPADEPLDLAADLFGGQSRLYGGAALCDADLLFEDWRDCQYWATHTWVAEFPEEHVLWLRAVPFAAMANGDYLALDPSYGADADPPVVYLAHDDESCRIAPTFEAFLQAWERLCYIGPEIWLLGEFREPHSGFLDAETVKAQQLRGLFGVE